MTTLLLGKKPARVDDRTLKLDAYTKPDFTVPAAKSWAGTVPAWPMLANDRYGDCVEAGLYHQTQLWLDADGIPVVPNEADTIKAYEEITGFNPRVPATDQGTDPLTALNYWRKTGIPWLVNGVTMRHVIDGFVSVNHTNHAEIKLGVAEFGGIGLGANMPLSAQAQFGQGKPWTVTKGPAAAPGSWGGHWIPIIGYNARSVFLVTWGKVQAATWGWVQTYGEEAYAILSKDWTGADDKAPSGVNFNQLRTDLGQFQ